MPKKGKEKSTAAPAKKAAPEDDFNIVFTNSDKEPKPKAKRSGPSTPQPEAATDGPPKPTVKQIIGGASWTGKLPVNLLSEHCQKQKWERPDYNTVRCPRTSPHLSFQGKLTASLTAQIPRRLLRLC